MVRHLARIILIAFLIALCIVYPFLSGEYDLLAMPLSTIAQGFGVLGVLLVPVGAVWLIAELRRRRRPIKGRGFVFAVITVIIGTLITAALTLAGLGTVGPSLALFLLVLGLYSLSKLIPILRAMRHSERDRFNPTPLYLVTLPLAALIVQIAAAAPLTASSRARAIASSAEMIANIEAYRQAQGRYPHSLLGVWKDYYPHVVGIERYYYRPERDAYNLYFEQPRFMLDRVGTREFVVYNPRDEHLMVSHPSLMLLLTPAQFESSPGWYRVHDAGTDHWRSFWFD
jgi:MFS family permease